MRQLGRQGRVVGADCLTCLLIASSASAGLLKRQRFINQYMALWKLEFGRFRAGSWPQLPKLTLTGWRCPAIAPVAGDGRLRRQPARAGLKPTRPGSLISAIPHAACVFTTLLTFEQIISNRTPMFLAPNLGPRACCGARSRDGFFSTPAKLRCHRGDPSCASELRWRATSQPDAILLPTRRAGALERDGIVQRWKAPRTT